MVGELPVSELWMCRHRKNYFGGNEMSTEYLPESVVFRSELGKLLRQRRFELHLTIAELCRNLQMGRGTIDKIMREGVEVRPETLYFMAKRLNLDYFTMVEAVKEDSARRIDQKYRDFYEKQQEVVDDGKKLE
jgi:transcriptional regulator with XRE-family HTH domain